MAFTMDSTTSTTKARLWFVDNLRVVLISLVVLHHLAGVYSGMPVWYYTERPTSGAVGLGLSVFLLLNQSWFMGAFFLLSGYFSPASYDRKGPRAFLRDRFVRLGVPLVVFYFVLNPILYLGTGINYLQSIGSGPLWFALALLAFDTSYAGYRQLTRSPRPQTPQPLRFRAVIPFVAGLAVVTYAVRIVIPMGLSVPVIDFPTSAYLPEYVSFFVLGMVAYRRGWFTATSARLGKLGLVLALGATVVFLPLALTVGGSWSGYGTLGSLFYALWDSCFAVGLVLALLTLFRRRFNSPSRLSGRVFTVYVIHALVVTAFARLLGDVGLPSLVKVTLGALVVLPACFLLAEPIRKLPGVRRVL
ncbi:acyltransferase family protein [Kribbella sp. NPDC055071]